MAAKKTDPHTADGQFIQARMYKRETSAELDALRAALISGENSGIPENFNVGAFKQKMLGTFHR